MITKTFLRLLVAFSLLAVALPSLAQDTLKVDKSLYYRGVLGGGAGSGRFFTSSNSTIGITLEVMVEKNKTIYGIGGDHFLLLKYPI